MSRRPVSRLTAAAVGAAIALAGCGSGSGGGQSSTPKGELVAGVQALSDSDVLTTTLKLETTPSDLQQLADSSGDHLSADTAQAISEAQLVIENVNGDESTKAVSIRALDGDVKLFELRVVEG